MNTLRWRKASAFAIPFLVAAMWTSQGCAAGPNGENTRDNGAATVQDVPKAATVQTASVLKPGGFSDPAEMYRQVIRSADLEERVVSVEKAERDVSRIVEQAGGFTESTSGRDLATNPVMKMVLRVPPPTFDDVIAKFETLGVRLAKSVDTQDVTEQLTQLGAQLRQLREREATLEHSKKANMARGQLANVQQAIQNAEARRAPILEGASLSTVNLTLEQGAAAGSIGSDPNWLSESFAEATSAGGLALKSVVIFAMWLAVFAPFWIPAAYLARRLARRAALRKT